MEINEIIAAVTTTPAQVLGMADSLGSLQVGREADITVLKLESGKFTFRDAQGEKLQTNQRFMPMMTLKGGTLLWENKEDRA
jgi:dihydroorotase